MNRGLIILNIVLLLAVAALFYLHFSSPKNSTVKLADAKTAPQNNSTCRIAYFEMDSVENSFKLFKDVKSELGKEEDRMNNEMAHLEKKYQDRIVQLQSQAQTMTQVQSENANNEVMQMRENLATKKRELDSKYQELYIRKSREVKLKIEDFLKEYNSEKNFSYIIAFEPSLFYYKDTAYNITGDVIKGLNERYDKKK